MIKKFLNLLKKDTGDSVAPENADAANDLEHFVDYVVRALVDAPDEVSISSERGEIGFVIQVRCAKDDIGKIIGKNGKTISAIRALVNGAGKRFDKEFNVEVLDD